MRVRVLLGLILMLPACASTATNAPTGSSPTSANQRVVLTSVPRSVNPTATASGISYVAGSAQKVCQLTGETDRQFHTPTVNQTVTRFGLEGTDLGYSFEHNGKLFFLFGDSVPSSTFNGNPNGANDPPRLPDDNDAIAFSTDTRIDSCPKLDFIRAASGAYKNPIVLNAQGQPAITLRSNETPIAGISAGGRIYVLFATGNPTNTARPPEPLGFSTRTVMAVSDDDATTFHDLYDFSTGPGAKFINTAITQGSSGYLYFWGTQGGALYRHSAPYFARKQAGLMDRAGGMEYFAGLGPDGTPRFSASEAESSPLFADYVDGSAAPHNCMGELGVEWNRFINRWVMLYNCLNDTPTSPRGISMRLAEEPWGPWSTPQTIFNPEQDRGFCSFIHRAVTPANPACDDLSAPNRLGESGGDYGPYFLSRFTTGDATRATSTFYFTLSTWNPYSQVIMKATIQGAP